MVVAKSKQPPPGRRQAGKQRRSEAILRVAQEALRREGASGLSMRKLAARAGVATMTAYKLFGSKAKIVEALFDEMNSASVDRLSHQSFADPVDKLLWLLQPTIHLMRTDPVYTRALTYLNVTLEMQPGSRTLRSIKNMLWREVVEEAHAAHLFRPEVSPESILFMLVDAHDAIGYQWAFGLIGAEEFELRCGLSFTVIFAGTMARRFQGDLRDRMQKFEAQLSALGRPQKGRPASGRQRASAG